MRPSVHPFTLSNMNISETRWPIKNKFHLEHHFCGGVTTLGFGQDRTRTLVSMATNSSPCYNGENPVTTLASSFLIVFCCFFILAGNEDNHKISNGFAIRQDRTRDV